MVTSKVLVMKHRGSSNRGTLSRLSWSIGCGLVVEEKSGKERERDKDEWRERERESAKWANCCCLAPYRLTIVSVDDVAKCS